MTWAVLMSRRDLVCASPLALSNSLGAARCESERARARAGITTSGLAGAWQDVGEVVKELTAEEKAAAEAEVKEFAALRKIVSASSYASSSKEKVCGLWWVWVPVCMRACLCGCCVWGGGAYVPCEHMSTRSEGAERGRCCGRWQGLKIKKRSEVDRA